MSRIYFWRDLEQIAQLETCVVVDHLEASANET